jgi:hypothetical protein
MEIEPEHTYYLPARGLMFGARAAEPEVRAMLEELWRRFGSETAGPHDGVSFLPRRNVARLTVEGKEGHSVFDVPLGNGPP